ncbi:hypothetical protein EJ08DRAFT_7722 [Tothia fuscella]|uniref:Uncharacterized protein n=1 Tax=Tothia fuscella TaxID=1048955 RepID=A0A9P4U3K1_9PEZI|nr:hypothetical protein EJ08DRAFT_7722 [Tothia fuscella]
MISRQFALSLRAGASKPLQSRSFSQSARYLKAGAGKKPLKTTRNSLPKLTTTPARVTAKEAAQAITKYAYPETPLIWKAPYAQTAWVGTTKLFSFLLFAASIVILAPRYIIVDDEPDWKAIPAMLLGAIPMIVTIITSSPYVSLIRIKLPKHARLSHDALLRFCQNPPMGTPIELTTLRVYGLARTSSLTLGELRRVQGRFGIANLERVGHEEVREGRSDWAKMTQRRGRRFWRVLRRIR